MQSNIWVKEFTIEGLNQTQAVGIHNHIGIQLVEIGQDYLKGTMPVDDRTRQPFGLLHGGASVVLAETLGSIAANLTVDPNEKYCVGLSINSNHIRSVREGVVIGTARPVHIGRSTQIWDIEIRDEAGRLVNDSRLTMSVLSHRKK